MRVHSVVNTLLIVGLIFSAFPPSSGTLAVQENWNAYGGQEGAGFGSMVSTAGDVNGDGFSDLIAGAPGYDDGQVDEGKVFVYFGSSNGLSDTPDWSAAIDQAGAMFGASVALAGDINADGYCDVLVGAPYFANGETDEGAVFLFLGSSSGLSAAADWSMEGGQAGAQMGSAGSIGMAGDVNGDGFGDVIIAAPYFDNTDLPDAGKVHAFFGSASGLGATPDWELSGDQAEAVLGAALGSAGDVNGDGFADVIVGAPYADNGQADEGVVFVYHGSTTGLSSVADWSVEGGQVGAWLGGAVSTAGDVNADGYADVVIGAPGHDVNSQDRGRVYVYNGSTAGLEASPDWNAIGDTTVKTQLGASVSPAGDVNGDGYADILVSAPGFDGDSMTNAGQAYLYPGGPDGIHSPWLWSGEGDQAEVAFGQSVSVAGDVNGDGYSDFVIGAPNYDLNYADEGQVSMYTGGVGVLTGNPVRTISAGQADAHLGDVLASAGDVNGDGYADVILGMPDYDNGQAGEGLVYVFAGSAEGLNPSPLWYAEGDQVGAMLGYSVSSAGDVNADGFSDILVGAPGFDGDAENEGVAYLYLGSASGPGTTPYGTFTMVQEDSYLGWSVASAGDVNADGYMDIAIGAPLYDENLDSEGAAFVYYGPDLGGLNGDPDWYILGGQEDAQLGSSLAGAGDVNGDGFSDLLVAALAYDNGQMDEGRVWIYHGSRLGIASIPAQTLESNQAGSGFGYSLSTAGDVNGDGYSDIVVGAYQYSAGESEEGRVFLYHGSSSGIGDIPSWTHESNQADAWMGYSVGTAGDVNGDGLSDLVLGVYGYDGALSNYGLAEVFLGNASGLAETADWSYKTTQALACVGAVAGAGDINGDGYTDVLVGSPLYDVSIVDEGAAMVFYGNNSDGFDLLPRQARLDDAWHLLPLAVSDASNSVRLDLHARAPMGVDWVKLEWRLAPMGLGFDDPQAISGRSADWLQVNPTGVLLSEHVDGLAHGTAYRWQVRLLYHPNNRLGQPAGPWLQLPWNAASEQDFRTNDLPVSGVEVSNDSPTRLSAPTVFQVAVESGTNLIYTWDFGDGTSLSTLDASVAHVYTHPGTFWTSVTVSNNANSVISGTSVEVYVEVSLPLAVKR